MSEPDYNKYLLMLVEHTAEYALFRTKTMLEQGSISVFREGDWEHYERGSFDEMKALYSRLTAPAPRATGIGLDSFDNAFPHKDWVEVESFETTVGVAYSLWKRRVRSYDPPAMSTSAFKIDSNDDVNWQVIDEGPLSKVLASFEQARLALVPKPAPRVSEYAEHPNFGRF